MGGSASGAVSWPTYLQDAHADWLTRGVPVEIDYCITDIMNSALGNSPWISLEAFNPTDILTESKAAIDAFAALLSGLDEIPDWVRFYDQAKASLAAAPDGLVVGDIEVADIVEIDNLEVDNITAIGDLSVTDAIGVTDAEIILDVDAFANQLDDEILIKVLPRFRRGMQDINAVVSSAFVIGASNIEGFRDRDVSKHSSTLRVNAAMKNADVDVANMNKDVQVGLGNISKNLDVGKVDITKDVEIGKANITKDLSISEANVNKNLQLGIANLRKDTQVGEINIKSGAEYERMYLDASSQMMSLLAQKISANDGLSRLVVDGNRIKIVALKEWTDLDNTMDIESATWDLEVFQYGGNLLAASSGGVGSGVHKEKPSAAVSAIGGALGGAATGSTIGGAAASWYGAGVGAIIGAAVGAAGGLVGRNVM